MPEFDPKKPAGFNEKDFEFWKNVFYIVTSITVGFIILLAIINLYLT